MFEKIDRIDLNILKLLQNDGRLTNVELSKHVGISPPPCLRRLKNLEDSKIIRGYFADINPTVFGFNVTIMAEITLIGQNDSDLRAFEEKIAEWPLVRECYLITGGSDFMLKIVAQSFDDYQNFMGNELSKMDKVLKIKTHMVLRATKMKHGIPLEIIGEKM